MTVSISETRDIAVCLALRRTVFIEEQRVPDAEDIDDLGEIAHHLIAHDSARAVGSARILIIDETASNGRVCVLKDQRGKGLGAALIRTALTLLARQPGVATAKLGAQVHALKFYEKLGFEAFGPIYLDAGIPHRDMKRPV